MVDDSDATSYIQKRSAGQVGSPHGFEQMACGPVRPFAVVPGKVLLRRTRTEVALNRLAMATGHESSLGIRLRVSLDGAED